MQPEEIVKIASQEGAFGCCHNGSQYHRRGHSGQKSSIPESSVSSSDLRFQQIEAKSSGSSSLKRSLRETLWMLLRRSGTRAALSSSRTPSTGCAQQLFTHNPKMPGRSMGSRGSMPVVSSRQIIGSPKSSGGSIILRLSRAAMPTSRARSGGQGSALTVSLKTASGHVTSRHSGGAPPS